ncbi:MAG: glycosyltransferase [Candidatus Kerfeldbacteria bacterium]|nr:glycosyltransferase [Candidatus Kerfeldbacteria bacterium]
MKISVIIPTYNEEKRIRKTLEQWQPFRGTDCEIIISDNGSSDMTTKIAAPLADTVLSITESERSSIGECRNRGARVATGDVLFFTDADVLIPHLNAVLSLVKQQFAQQKKLIAVALPSRLYPEEERVIDRFWFGVVNANMYFVNMIGLGGAGGDCQIIRRASFEEINGYNPALYTSEDWDIFHRLTRLGKTRVWMKYPMRMSGRRIHRDGWGCLLWSWFTNWLSQCVFKRSNETPWEARR